MSSRFVFLSCIVAFTITTVRGALDLGYGDDSDLTHFVTRPDIKAPRFNVTIYGPVTPGFWFLAPYAHINQDTQARNYYQPCQTGPHIYDGNGELIWSGACMVRNQNTCDFRAWQFNDTFYLSAILTTYGNDTKGHAILMGNSYNVLKEIHTPADVSAFNMHELNLHNNGRTAMHLQAKPQEMEFADSNHGLDSPRTGRVMDMGFRELDIATGETLFEWWAAREGHVSFAENTQVPRARTGLSLAMDDWFHANSLDKNNEGDFLISSRFTDTIYKVSGRNGTILWRLGGRNSSFSQDFTFSRQHDARWQSIAGQTELISFLDNASDFESQTSPHSSALIIELDRSAMVAKVAKRSVRPDRRLTYRRGNHQVLQNGNSFVCWSDNSYLTEFDPNGRVLMEASFQSDRFVTYRAYKHNFTGVPNEQPAIQGFVYGDAPAYITVVYVSWNGATDIAMWNLYGFDGRKRALLIAVTTKTRFEEILQANGCFTEVFAEAIAANGSAIGSSPVIDISPALPVGVNLPTISTRQPLSTAAMTGSEVKPTMALRSDIRLLSTTDNILVWCLIVMAFICGVLFWRWCGCRAR